MPTHWTMLSNKDTDLSSVSHILQWTSVLFLSESEQER